MGRGGFVYILASRRDGVLYIGVTSDLAKRIWQHRQGAVEGFTKQYDVKTLVYVEAYPDIESARAREVAMKRWKRAWKVRLIEEGNPEWRDLYDDILK